MVEIIPIPPNIQVPDELKGIPLNNIPQQVQGIVSPHYDLDTISRLERELQNMNLDLPASKSPDIPEILNIIEQITDGTSLQEIYTYLEDTQNNSHQSRNDLQRCGSLLQKIAGIKGESINWKLIFSRLELYTKTKEAA